MNETESPRLRRGGRAARLQRRAPVRLDASSTLNAWSRVAGDTASRTLVIACGALIAELRQVIEINAWDHIELTGIPADYHVTPDKITAAVEAKIRLARGRYADILVGFGDCGTRGALDAMLLREGIPRIEGAHCYAFYAGLDQFDAMHAAEPGTFYLTDFLARHFEAFTVRGLQIDRHPELKADYFANYRRVVYLAQLPDAEKLARAQAIADWFGLPLEVRETGLTGLARFLAPAAKPTSGERTLAGTPDVG
jgi:hypothetical protein